MCSQVLVIGGNSTLAPIWQKQPSLKIIFIRLW